MQKAISLFVCFWWTHSLAGQFVSLEGERVENLEQIWEHVNNTIGSCPDKIKYRVDTSKKTFSRFKGQPPLVVLNQKDSDDQLEMVLSHETSHVCLFAKTKGASNLERFRFIDEGLANIIGGQAVNARKEYRTKSLKVAKKLLNTMGISFTKVQAWTKYFGRPPKADFDAYNVGSTFIFFIEESYGKERVEKFYLKIGEHRDLGKAVREAFGISLEELEKNWLAYIRSS